MINKQQTAVDWFFIELQRMQYFIGNDMLQAYKDAKEMEKLPIIDAWHNGYNNRSPMIDEDNCGEAYYKENYEQ